MIVVDTSALVSIFREEPGYEAILEAILGDTPVISAAAVLECSIVIRMMKTLTDARAEAWLDAMLTEMRITVSDVTAAQIKAARQAHARYGKGTGHGAGLNFGDCFSYALARSLGAPLLYRGNDFAKTDIVSALV